MRIEPEQMLEKDGVATHGGIKKAQVEHALEAGEQQRDCDDRSAENHHQAGCVMGPDKERQAEPGHARSAHGMNGDDEVKAGEDGGEAVNENTDDGGCDRGIRVDAAERRVEGPAGVQAAGAERIEDEAAAKNIDIPAQEIDFRE